MPFATDAGLRNCLLAGQKRDPFRKRRWRHVVLVDVIDGAGDCGAQAVERKTRNAPDTGFAGGQFRPIVGLADAERRDNAHAGDGNHRAASLVAMRASRGLACSHNALLQFARSSRAKPSPRQLPMLVTTTWRRPSGLAPASPDPIGANNLPCSIAAQPIPRLAMN